MASPTKKSDQRDYDTLGISQNASQDEIKKAYRSLTRQCHPDKKPEYKEVEKQFRKIDKAYKALLK